MECGAPVDLLSSRWPALDSSALHYTSCSGSRNPHCPLSISSQQEAARGPGFIGLKSCMYSLSLCMCCTVQGPQEGHWPLDIRNGSCYICCIWTLRWPAHTLFMETSALSASLTETDFVVQAANTIYWDCYHGLYYFYLSNRSKK